MEEAIIKLLTYEHITPKAAAFLIHAIMEMSNWIGDSEAQKEFKRHVLELFKYDN
jgi:hypothetical protein